MSEHFKEKITAAPTTAAIALSLYHSRDSFWQDEYSQDELLTVRHLLRKVADAGIVG